MQQIPSILTPDFGLMFWMLLAFLIVFAILAKFGFPVIIKSVEERKRYIEESLDNARLANEKLAHIQVEGEKIISEAHVKSNTIIKEAENTSQNIIEEAKQKAQAQSQQIILESKQEIKAEKEAALREIQNETLSLSIAIAEQLLAKQLDNKEEQEAYIERLLNNVK